jgi:hypothetical protein
VNFATTPMNEERVELLIAAAIGAFLGVATGYATDYANEWFKILIWASLAQSLSAGRLIVIRLFVSALLPSSIPSPLVD